MKFNFLIFNVINFYGCCKLRNFNYFIYLMHTTNTTEFILGFIRFYVLCLSTLITEKYEMLSYVDIMNIKESGWHAGDGGSEGTLV